MNIVKKSGDYATIVEVSPRDGLPAVCGGTSTANKIMYINSLVNAGLTQIEAAAFTHPRLIPENADAEKIVDGIAKKSDVTYIGLVPNEIGCRRAVVTEINEILTLIAASDIFNQLNTGRTKKQSLNKALPAILEAAGGAGKKSRTYIMTAFGCPYTGRIPSDEVIHLFLKLTYMGVKEIVLLDSTGMANPRQVKELVRQILALETNVNVAVHFHNTRGSAIANCVAAYEAGVRIFYTSIGGLSGTPYGAMELGFGYWNVPTEDLVHLFEEMGIDTGIDINRLLECVKIAEVLAGSPLPGHILRANPNKRLADIPDLSFLLSHDLRYTRMSEIMSRAKADSSTEPPEVHYT
ncbi:MAG: hydroxymethylglutaryl-CoA lyase [Syntrophales bacterium]|nr:hydroxymethylglutaryl-CoA lyase [Syntrophales bacterium]